MTAQSSTDMLDMDAEEEDTVSPQVGVRRIAKRRPIASDLPTALAFVMSDAGYDPVHHVTVVQWTDAAYNQLVVLAKALRTQTPDVSLPVVSLRGRLELADQHNLRLDRSVGITKDKTLLWTVTAPDAVESLVNNAVQGWLIENVTQQAQVPDAKAAVTQLKDLVRKNLAITVHKRDTQVFQWDMSLSKTAKATSRSSYADLADFVAHSLEGAVIFPDLSPLRRIASGQLEQNQAELMTEPVTVGRGSHFSLVVRIRIFSYPGRPTPVVVIEFGKRVWTTGLREKSSAKTLSGYALPDGSTRALRFTLKRVKTAAGWTYEPDEDFAPIARTYFAKPNLSTQQILKEGHGERACKLLVVLKHGAGERSETKSGVPDKDKMDGFTGLHAVMAKIGLVPWDGLTYMETSTRDVKDRDQHWRKRESDKADDQKKFAAWLQEAQQSIRDVYAGEHHLVIAVQPGHEDDAREAQQRLKDILQESVTITRVSFSSQAHGPRNELPEPKKNNSDRAAVRKAEWDGFIQLIKQSGRKVDGVLVIAREWYAGNQHDDQVNKRAARIAIAQGLGVPVQYLRPRDEKRDEVAAKPQRGKKKTEAEIRAEIDQDFENRLMIGWLDLAFKSVGRVKPGKVQAEAKKVYQEEIPTLFGSYPDRILALGVVRRNTTRFIHNERSFLPFAIELDVESGTCSARFAYEGDGKQPVHTSLMPLPEALVTLAGLGPVQLTSTSTSRIEEMKRRTQAFFKDALIDFGKRAMRPLVLVDADTSRSVWPWLRDEDMDPNNVHLDGTFHAEAAWRHARFVRVRTNNSPKILWDKHFEGAVQDDDGNLTNEVIRYHAPDAAEAELFKLADTHNTHVYLSFGSTIRTNQTLGLSCYRQLDGMKLTKDEATKSQYYVAETRDIHKKAWTTPIGVEIVVVRPGSDQPDQVARLVEWLRQCYVHFGEWTVKPAPLYFERVLKEYIADYDLEEGEDEEDSEKE